MGLTSPSRSWTAAATGFQRSALISSPTEQEHCSANSDIGIRAAHAAKFGNLLGHILSDPTLTGSTSFPIEAFRADRPTLTDPNHKVQLRLVG